MFKPAVFSLIVSFGVCFAQADRAAVTGTVLDPSRSVVPSAKISIVYSDTGLRRETASSASGVFHLGGLPIGQCYLEVNSNGFRPVKTKSFTLSVGETRTLDVTLEVAASTATVEVQGVSESLTQSTAAISAVTTTDQLNDLPVNGRNWASLMALVGTKTAP